MIIGQPTKSAMKQAMTKRDWTRIAVLIALTLSISSLFYTYRNNLWYPSSATVKRPMTAAVIDEVSAFIPDPQFNSSILSVLTSAGYRVDYYQPGAVTIQLFKELPSMGYGIVIIRDHSTGSGTDGISIVTSELYSSNKYAFEQLSGEVARVNLGVNGLDYFSITPQFVREAMQGFFPGSIIVMMGCTGLASSEMAQAFVARGAQVYVSWNQVVQAYRTDVSTTIFLQQMTQGHSIEDSTSIATRLGPRDPIYHSQFEYYPSNAGSMTISY